MRKRPRPKQPKVASSKSGKTWGNPSNLTLPQVRMILRIYWMDRYLRQAKGLTAASHGLRNRLARQFGASPEVIKKIVAMGHNPGKRRKRFGSILIPQIKRLAKKRLKTLYGVENVSSRSRTSQHANSGRRAKQAGAGDGGL